MRWIKAVYLPLLDRALARRGMVIAARSCCWPAALATFPFLGKEFMPTLQEGAIMFRVTGIPSTSLEESVRVSREMDEVLKRAIPADHDGARHDRPRGEGRDDRRELHGGARRREAEERMAAADDDARAVGERCRRRWRRPCRQVVLAATQPIQMRVEELISGVRATLALKVYGPDLATSTGLPPR